MSINMKETMNTEQKYITQNDRLKWQGLEA